MDRDEFLAAYAARSGQSAEKLLESRDIYPCACGDPMCAGWAALPKNAEPMDVFFATGIMPV